jgi:hypothetical protein
MDPYGELSWEDSSGHFKFTIANIIILDVVMIG